MTHIKERAAPPDIFLCAYCQQRINVVDNHLHLKARWAPKPDLRFCNLGCLSQWVKERT